MNHQAVSDHGQGNSKAAHFYGPRQFAMVIVPDENSSIFFAGGR